MIDLDVAREFGHGNKAAKLELTEEGVKNRWFERKTKGQIRLREGGSGSKKRKKVKE